MIQLILIFHVLIALFLCGLILMQQGKGAGIGAAFGSGASNTVFGSRGAGGFLFKLTGVLACIFFATSISLTYFASHRMHQQPKGLLNSIMNAKELGLLEESGTINTGSDTDVTDAQEEKESL